MSLPVMVRLQLDVEDMRHSVMHALAVRQSDIQKTVEAEVQRLLTSGHLESVIAASVRKHLTHAIDGAVKQAMGSWARDLPTVQQAIQREVAKALSEMTKEVK
jgi:hypothetical protein